MTTKKDIESRGGTCEKIATDFWECKDKSGQVWWCSDGGDVCVMKPKVGVEEPAPRPEGPDVATKGVGDLIREGAKCTPVSDELTICLDARGGVWACSKTNECVVILTPDKKDPQEAFERLTFLEQHLIAIVPHPEDPDERIEIVYQKRKGSSKGGESLTFCEICITRIDSQGNRETACSAIPCPKGRVLGPIGPGKKS